MTFRGSDRSQTWPETWRFCLAPLGKARIGHYTRSLIQ